MIEDAEVGRVYLPENWLTEAGIPVKEISHSAHRARLFKVVRRVLREADRYYASSWLGISQLPLRSAWAVAAANAVYSDIGSLVLERGPAAWDGRTSTGTGRKIALTLKAGLQAAGARAFGPGPESQPRTGLWTRPRTDSA